MRKPIRVFYDGDCPRCRRLAARYAALDRVGHLDWMDLNTSAAELSAAGIDAETALARLHAVDETGRIHAGGAALAVVWDVLPRRRWLARLARLPVVSRIIGRIYAFVARRRSRVPEQGPP